ncbi:hypothetical protein ACFSQ7_46725 [Paenibacillus rhizoplanae]
MTDKLYDLLDFLEGVGVDLVIVCFPWYISDECSQGMDDYFDQKFHFLPASEHKGERSWHAFNYKLDPERIPALMSELDRVNHRVWKNAFALPAESGSRPDRRFRARQRGEG